jgi:hypothetical protein
VGGETLFVWNNRCFTLRKVRIVVLFVQQAHPFIRYVGFWTKSTIHQNQLKYMEE